MTNDSELPDFPFREPPEPCSEVSAKIRRDCTRDLDKKRCPSPLRRALVTVLTSSTVLGILIVLGVLSNKPDGALRAALLGAAAWGVIHASVLFFGLVRPPGRRGSRSIRLGLALALPIVFFGYLAFAAESTLPFPQFLDRGVGHTSACGLLALFIGALAAGSTLFVWRRTDPLTPGLSGAIAGLLGGIVGAVGIGVACPSGEGWHLFLAHGTTVLVFVIAGALVGRRWLAP